MKNDSEKRFIGRLTEEYHLVALAYPHIEEFQSKVSSLAHEHLRTIQAGKVVEIGCGDGITTDLLLNGLGVHELVAIDNEPKMVEQAKRNLGLIDRPQNFSVECADALAYLRTLEDTSVDVVATVWTLHNFLKEYRAQVVREIVRVLRPGGLFVNGDKYAQGPSTHAVALNQQLRRFFDAYLPLGKYDFLRDFVLHNVADEAPDRLMTEADSLSEVAEMGCRANVVYRNGMEGVLVAKKQLGQNE
jgi:SAM-dependent methyltransferase